MSYKKLTQLQPRMIIGTKQTLKAMIKGDVEEVYVAKDADQQITNKVVEEAKRLQIPYVIVDSKKRLGKACQIEVGASTVAIKRR